MTMNHTQQAQIDRLVDGELTSVERRELLLALEQSQEGWRQCALAFVEAQTWQAEFSAYQTESTGSDEPAAALRVAEKEIQPASRVASKAGYWAALAAGLLLAFSLGWAVDRPGGEPSLDGMQLAGQPPTQPDTTTTPNEQMQRAEQKRFEPSLQDEAITFWVADESGQRQSLRVPLLDAEAVEQKFGLRFASQESSELTRHLEERGYRMETQQRFAPLFVEGGRPFVVPVHDAQITPVSTRPL